MTEVADTSIGLAAKLFHIVVTAVSRGYQRLVSIKCCTFQPYRRRRPWGFKEIKRLPAKVINTFIDVVYYMQIAIDNSGRD